MEPTLIIDEKHTDDIFNEEFFAPILAVYPYRSVCIGCFGSIFSNNYNMISEIKDSLSKLSKKSSKKLGGCFNRIYRVCNQKIQKYLCKN